MKRSLQIASAAALTALLAIACSPSLELGARPNILLIVVDCLRADHVGTYGYQRPTTPRLDELAAEGVTFERAFAQSYWTRPSLPTILTALYPSEHGLLSLDRDERGRWVGAALDPQVSTVTEELKAAGYATALVAYQRQLAPKFGMAEGFDYFHYQAGTASSINGRFLDWQESIEADRFFAYLHYLDIHWPYCPPSTTRDRFDTGESQVAFCKDWKQLRRRLWSGQQVLSEVDVARAMARYDEELLALDGKLGEVLETLRMRGLWDDTLVVVTADHGEEFMEHGELDHSSGPYDTLIHVPLIVKPPASWPGPRGARVDSLVELRALKPTFLDAAGLADERPPDSLVPWIVDRPSLAQRREYVVAESDTHVALRTEDLKLVVERSGSETRLFDLIEDPGETRDVAAERPEDVARLRRLLVAWRASLRPTQAAIEVLDSDTVEGLRDLGYLD